jgi:hypothetical protein
MCPRAGTGSFDPLRPFDPAYEIETPPTPKFREMTFMPCRERLTPLLAQSHVTYMRGGNVFAVTGRRMPSSSASPDELLLRCHFVYEIKMLVETYRRCWAEVSNDGDDEMKIIK